MIRYWLVVFVFFAGIEVAKASVQSEYVDITDKRIQILNNSDGPRVIIQDFEIASSSCNNKTTPMIFFSGNELAAEMYSMVLAAKTTGRPIKLVAGACKEIGGVTYTSIDSVWLW